MRRSGALVAAALGLGLVVTGCTADDGAPAASDPQDTVSASPAPEEPTETPDEEETPDPDQPTSWGPTEGELATARELVAEMSPEELAGQVIVGRYAGTDPAEAARLVSDLHLSGVCVTGDNVVDEAQVRATTAAVSEAVAGSGRDFPAVIGVDQEGGLVSHLRGVATEFPAFEAAGAAVDGGGRSGKVAVRDAAYTTGLELRDLGFTWVYAPVADVTIGAADPTIGSRSPSTDPRLAAKATAAAVDGFDRSGTVSTTKHYPGHGGATADSHLTLPELDAPMTELQRRDLMPFRAATKAGAPSVMIGHLDVEALAPGTPSSIAPEVYEHLREEVGFEGVAITDSLGMGAVAGIPDLAVEALVAGADLLLMPADTRRTHARVTRAIREGEVEPERIEEAAARVVALQLWQERTAEEQPVPDDISARAAEAAQALEVAAYAAP